MEPPPSKRPKAPAVQITDGDDQRVEGEDRISSLPEAVLALILSRLPTKCAISTSVLSTKWRHLFSLIHHPSIEIYDVEQPPPRSTSFINPRFINPSFIHFVSHLFNKILPQFPLIDLIDLTLYENYGKQRIDQWFSTATPCNVRCLRLYTAAKGNGISSFDVLRPFASVSRLELYFQRCNIYDHHSTLLFPNLTWLSLNGLNFEGYNLLERALAACPNLRRLHLIRCKFDYGEEVICISVPSLRILLLCGCYREELGLIIETPILESLYYNEHVSNIYPMLDSPAFGSLVTATLNVKPSVGISNFPMLDYTENVAKLMAAFSGVTSLDISVRKIAVNDQDNFRMPTFPNLTKLDIGIVDIVGWEILAMFLQSSPLLRVLSVFPRQELRLKLAVSGHMDYYERFQSHLTDAVPLCLSSHLSEFVFQEFKGDKDDCRVVQYFLRAARVLKKMQICFLDSVSQEEVLEIKDYILTSPICSTNCHIDIVMQNEDAY